MSSPLSPSARRGWAAAAMVFGLMTLLSGGRALFGSAKAQADAGQIVPWVLWFNFIAGAAYVAAGAGLWQGAAPWPRRLATGIAAATAAVGLAFAAHVATGGAYEMRTVGAMVLRVGFWGVLAVVLWRHAQPRLD
ncbi:MAG: hypothetical protein JNM97_17325 [Rhodoferax sp.]|nr:hypothetical protein [Rhodoferax sp.]